MPSEFPRIVVVGNSVNRGKGRPLVSTLKKQLGRDCEGCLLLRRRLGASRRLSTTVVPHQDGHDERPHRQENEAHQVGDRRAKAFVAHHHRAVIHERGSGNQCHPSRPARVDGAKRDSHSVQEEGQSRKEEREAVHAYLGPPHRLSGREGGSLLVRRSARPGIHGPLEGYAIHGLKDRKRGRRRHRCREAKGRKPCTYSGLGTNGVIESDQATKQEEEAEVLSEVNGGPDIATGVLHEDGRIVHGIFPRGMKVLRKQDHDDPEGQCHRSYAGSDRVIPSDLPTGDFACVHHLLLYARAVPAHYTLLALGWWRAHPQRTRSRNLLGELLRMSHTGPTTAIGDAGVGMGWS